MAEYCTFTFCTHRLSIRDYSFGGGEGERHPDFIVSRTSCPRHTNGCLNCQTIKLSNFSLASSLYAASNIGVFGIPQIKKNVSISFINISSICY